MWLLVDLQPDIGIECWNKRALHVSVEVITSTVLTWSHSRRWMVAVQVYTCLPPLSLSLTWVCV